MPTVSAAQALEELQSSSTTRWVSTGLPRLDAALLRGVGAISGSSDGGVVRGQVTEIYGPPGVGKTALGIQLAAGALHAGQSVVWVDAAHPLPGPRLERVMSCPSWVQDALISSANPRTSMDLLKNLVHFTTPTLPHLIALLCHPSPSFPPPGTSLIIIDSLSSVISSTYARTLDHTARPRKPGTATKTEPQQWAAARKWPVVQSLISSLQKLAALRNIAVVLLNQSVTKMQAGLSALLVPAISSIAWDAGIATRIVLFRDWGWEGRQVRFAKVLKAKGEAVGEGTETTKVVPFTIELDGLQEDQFAETTMIPSASTIATPSRKRKRETKVIRDSADEDDLEDSDDEDYGWAEDEEELLDQPPQWQRSEDILAPAIEGEEEIDNSEEGIAEA